MLVKFDYIRELEDNTRIYSLTNRLLDSFGYSPENRLHPKDLNKFINRASDEKGATYSALEDIVNKIHRYNQPKSSARKIAGKAFELFTLPMEALVYLKDRVWSATGSRDKGLVLASTTWIATALAIMYTSDKFDMPELNVVLHGWLITQFLAYVISGRGVLKYNFSESDANPIFQKYVETKGSVLQKVEPGYDLIEEIGRHFITKK